MELRKHQKLAMQMARESIMAGKKRPIVAAPTSFGKTVLAAAMLKSCQDKGKKGWFICDRIQLVKQTIDKFREFGIEFGVRQADHELSDSRKPIQIASIQTLAAMVKSRGGQLPDMDFVIVDECDVDYAFMDVIRKQFDNIPIIGLTATPYSKGLGLKYNNLLVPVTQRELLDLGLLCPVKYYGGAHIDVSKVKSLNPNTFDAKSLEEETDKDSERLVGGIIENWLKWGENAQTIAFSPSKKHSRWLVSEFNRLGVSAEHIDCDFKEEERQELFAAHDRGEFKILSCSKLLGVGYDAPKVKVVIDAYSTKSVKVWVQRVGRLMRLDDDKEYAIYLDHASNFERFGFAEDIVPESLHCDEKVHNESSLTREKKEPKVKECPDCYQQFVGIKCEACGYTIPMHEQLEQTAEDLVELQKADKKALDKANKTVSKEDKAEFLGGLQCYGENKGYKKGWAANKYKEKFGVYPNAITPIWTSVVPSKVSGFIQHSQIKYAKGKLKRGAI